MNKDTSKYCVEFVKNSDLNDEWDDFVKSSPQCGYALHSWWLKEHCTDEFKILTLWKNGKIVAGIPLKYGGYFGEKPPNIPFSLFNGVVLAKTQKKKYSAYLSEEMDILRNIISHIPDGIKLSLSCHPSFTNLLPFLWVGATQSVGYTYICENIRNTDILWDGLRTNIRTDIKKAEKSGVFVDEDPSCSVFWELTNKTWKRQGLIPPFNEDVIKNTHSLCLKHNAGKILIAYDKEKTPLGGLFYTWANDTAYFLLSCADPELRSIGVTSLIYWKGMLDAAKVAEKVNYCGSVISSIERVLRAFGAIQTPYFKIELDNRPKIRKAVWDIRVKAGKFARKIGLRK